MNWAASQLKDVRKRLGIWHGWNKLDISSKRSNDNVVVNSICTKGSIDYKSNIPIKTHIEESNP
ncbi:conserved hypothetical protein [Ricinus communis]|uniref:Uncharacterized protein n=1 Tax=Ricinus communis TaxID=3988 RepID=B9SWW5_RICCO|nr:conserved hypothetical protein [Ricinus communis]